MRVHLVWDLGRSQLGLETSASTRYCRMMILRNVSVVALILHRFWPF